MDRSLLEPALVVEARTPLSKVIPLLLRRRRDEAVIVEGSRYRGVVYGRDIARRRSGDPASLPVRHFLTRVAPAGRLDTSSLLNAMTINDYKSVPVLLEGKYYIATNLSLLADLQSHRAFARPAREVMRYPYAISSSDTLFSALNLCRDMDIERIPVLGENERLDGLLTTNTLLRAWTERTRPRRGETTGEELHPLEVRASSFAEQNYLTASPDTPVAELARQMAGKQLDTVLVTEGRRLTGIITPKNILRLVGEERTGAIVSISGLRVVESFQRDEINEHTDHLLRRLANIVPVDYLAVHVEQQQKGGVKTRYTLHARLITGKGFYFAQAEDWKLGRAFTRLYDTLWREAEKRHAVRSAARRDRRRG